MTYSVTLATDLPWVTEVDTDTALQVAQLLLGGPDRGSFAMTCEPGLDRRRVYLSDTAVTTVDCSGILGPPKKDT